MSRWRVLSRHDIDAVKAAWPIEDLIGQYVHLKRKGSDYFGCCPFHSEKTPSFTVNPENQFYYCFGCGARGDHIQFLQDYEHISFRQAIAELSRYHPGPSAEARTQARKPKPKPKRNFNDLIQRLLDESLDSSRLSSYMLSRGVPYVACDDLRYHRHVSLKRDDGTVTYHPAMLAIVRDVHGKRIALHRIYLQDSGSKLGPKRTLNTPTGGAVRLSDAWSHVDLAVCEGIETGWAVQQMTSAPVWAGLSSGGLAAMNVPSHVCRVCVWADSDEAGEHAAMRLMHRLSPRGVAVRIRIPNSGDWLDHYVRAQNEAR
jgi:DNA primase